MGVLFVLVLFIRFEPPTSAVRRAAGLLICIGADRRQWRMQGSGGPPERGMSRSDKGWAVPGEGEQSKEQEEGRSKPDRLATIL